MAGDWLKLHRSILDSSVFADDWHCRLFIWCLCKANFTPSTFKSQSLNRGEFITGRISGADELHVSPSKFYRGLHQLEEQGCISLSANSNWTTVSVCNYETYQHQSEQDRTANEQQVNSERTANEQQVNTEKEFNNAKNSRTQELNTLAAEFQIAWNSRPGVVPCRKVAGKRLISMKTRLADDDWKWRDAIAKFPLRCFADNPGGFQPNVDWFLRPDTVNKILEGAYDWSKSNSSQRPRHDYTIPQLEITDGSG